MMKVTVAKWGNSLAVRLPRSVAADLGFGPGTQLDLFVADRGIHLHRPAKSSADLLREMVEEMKRLGPENEPSSVDWGPDVGTEVIEGAYSRGEVTLQDILKRKSADKSRKNSKSDKHRDVARRR